MTVTFTTEKPPAGWQDRAECNGYWDVFAPTFERPCSPEIEALALSICAGCPVIQQCLSYTFTTETKSMSKGFRYGIVAGTTPDQRNQAYREWMETQPSPPTASGDYRLCEGCKRPTRPSNQSVFDHPGTVPRCNKDYCGTCYQRIKKEEAA